MLKLSTFVVTILERVMKYRIKMSTEWQYRKNDTLGVRVKASLNGAEFAPLRNVMWAFCSVDATMLNTMFCYAQKHMYHPMRCFMKKYNKEFHFGELLERFQWLKHQQDFKLIYNTKLSHAFIWAQQRFTREIIILFGTPAPS
jgi:hypothetical protein